MYPQIFTHLQCILIQKTCDVLLFAAFVVHTEVVYIMTYISSAISLISMTVEKTEEPRQRD